MCHVLNVRLKFLGPLLAMFCGVCATGAGAQESAFVTGPQILNLIAQQELFKVNRDFEKMDPKDPAYNLVRGYVAFLKGNTGEAKSLVEPYLQMFARARDRNGLRMVGPVLTALMLREGKYKKYVDASGNPEFRVV